MSLNQHKQYNVMLNELVQKSPGGERVKYKHTRERDRFYKLSNGRKIRVTTDQQTGEIVPNGVLEKTRIADLNIYSPNQAFDYRISVSLESPASIPEGSHMFERNKDRLSYSQGNIQFDLTQVKSPDSIGQQDVTHELELEFIDANLLAAEKRKQAQGEASEFANMIEVFLDNARMLSKRGGRA
ncbi:mRNA-capping enzyme subunit beta [Umbelopsis sp. WA50703]